MKTFQDLVKQELSTARQVHYPIRSLHEGFAVLLEEVDELWQEIKKKYSRFNREHVLEEAVQVGAMAQRLAEDCSLLE